MADLLITPNGPMVEVEGESLSGAMWLIEQYGESEISLPEADHIFLLEKLRETGLTTREIQDDAESKVHG